MTANAIDRRVARTREVLQRALISLIATKSYDAITVEEICAEANVGRSTFYLHYRNKDALKRSGLDHLRHALIARQKQSLAHAHGVGNDGLGFGLALFEHARDHLALYRALMGTRGGNVALDGIREILSDLVRRDLAATGRRKGADAVPVELTVRYVVGAYMAVLTWWLDQGATISPQRIDAMCRWLALDGIPLQKAKRE